MPSASNLADLFTTEDKYVVHYESIRDQMVMPRKFFGLPDNSYSSNNSYTQVALERGLSDRNYDKMTKLTKSTELIHKTKNDIIVKAHTASQL